jgi:hypothetical protein
MHSSAPKCPSTPTHAQAPLPRPARVPDLQDPARGFADDSSASVGLQGHPLASRPSVPKHASARLTPRTQVHPSMLWRTEARTGVSTFRSHPLASRPTRLTQARLTLSSPHSPRLTRLTPHSPPLASRPAPAPRGRPAPAGSG